MERASGAAAILDGVIWAPASERAANTSCARYRHRETLNGRTARKYIVDQICSRLWQI